MSLLHELHMVSEPVMEGATLGKPIKQFETGTGLFKSDIVTVFDASADTSEQPVPDHVTDLNSYVADILDSVIVQPEVITVRRPLSRVRGTATAVNMALFGGI
nr:hypothetical protein [Candidatus Levybacteria bacterium]